jgi:outer membrane protein assembly factor BamB
MSFVLGLLLSVIGPAENWPGFLGAGSNVSEATGIPLQWSPSEGIAWQTPLVGHGQSSPVIWNQRVFLSSVVGPKKDECIVSAYSLLDGKQVWSHTFANTDPVENSVYVSRAAPTPVVDADRVIVFFESGDLVALDHDGKELWKRAIHEDYGKFKNKFGIGSSPVQDDQHVFILIDDEGPSYLLAIEKATGKTVWRVERTPRSSWSSPGIVQAEGLAHIVVSSDGSVDGYHAGTGELLWSYTNVGGNTGASPIDLGEGRFFVAASAGRDGKNTELAKKSNLLMRIEKGTEGWQVKPVWNTEEASPSWASPIAYRDCAYWVNRVGVVYCFDLATGKLHYKERTDQSCWATPVGIGDRVYFFGKDGLTTVLAAGPKFEVLAKNQLWDPDQVTVDPQAGANEGTEERRRAAAMFSGPTIYGVAVAEGFMVIRVGEQLYGIHE